MPAPAPPDDRREQRDKTVMRLYEATERTGHLDALYAAYDAGMTDGAAIAAQATVDAIAASLKGGW